jgi:hypothetical protein
MSDRSFPPVGALYREIIRTSDDMFLEEFRSDTNSFRAGWMGNIDEEKGHKISGLL